MIWLFRVVTWKRLFFERNPMMHSNSSLGNMEIKFSWLPTTTTTTSISRSDWSLLFLGGTEVFEGNIEKGDLVGGSCAWVLNSWRVEKSTETNSFYIRGCDSTFQGVWWWSVFVHCPSIWFKINLETRKLSRQIVPLQRATLIFQI